MEVREPSARYFADASVQHSGIGVLPSDWRVERLSDFATVTSGKRLPLGRSLTNNETPHPYIRVTDMCRGTVDETAIQYVPDDVFPCIQQYRIFSTDLYISVAGTLGLVGMVPITLDGANLTENANRISNIRGSKEYLYQVLCSPAVQSVIQAERTVGAQPKLALGRIRDFKIPLPATADEQAAIGRILTDADALIDSLEQLLTKKRQIKQGAMQELLSGCRRLLPRAAAWRRVPLAQLGRWSGGMTPSMARPDYWSPQELPWLSSGDIKTARLSGSAKWISRRAVADGATTVVPAGSLVVVMRSGILRKYFPLAMTLQTMAINQDLKALQPSSDAVPEFLLHSLTYSGERILASCLKSGTTVESVEFGWLKQFTVSLPSVPEQKAIAQVLTDMDAEVEALESRLAKAYGLKEAMAQALLTGRIRLVPPQA